MMSPVASAANLSTLIKAQALALGFDLVGITTPGPAESFPQYEDWLASGYAGEMQYLHTGADKRRSPASAFPQARSAIVVGLDYGGRSRPGAVARYARGDDYHDVMLAKLNELHRWIGQQLDETIAGKAYVDTGPVLERDLARRAGLGWFGKNTMLVNPKNGSSFFIGALLLDVELDVDAPFEADRCGSCTRCIDACPTNALEGNRILDATKCIAYLTIELRTPIPEQLRPQIGTWIYGCDVCQDVCPWNVRFARELTTDSPFAARESLAEKDARTLAHELLGMTQTEFSAAFKGSPMKRAKLAGLKRNAAVVLGNIGDESDADVLSRARDDPAGSSQDVAAHAKWALAQIGSRARQ
jgi:epoxyqueuosine reductase